MKENIRLAKELIKVAKKLVADDDTINKWHKWLEPKERSRKYKQDDRVER